MDESHIDLLGKSVLFACIAGAAVYCGVVFHRQPPGELAKKAKLVEEIVAEKAVRQDSCYDAVVKQKEEECASYRERLENAESELVLCRAQLKQKKERLEQAMTEVYRTRHVLSGVQETLELMAGAE